jgi:transposase
VIAARKAAHPSVSGHQGRYEMREIVNALLYQGRTGCQWDLLAAGADRLGAEVQDLLAEDLRRDLDEG